MTNAVQETAPQSEAYNPPREAVHAVSESQAFGAQMLELASSDETSDRESLQFAGALLADYGEAGIDRAQRALEIGQEWDDAARELAAGVNQVERDGQGLSPLSREDIFSSLSKRVRDGRASGVEELQNEANAFNYFLNGSQRGDPLATRELLRLVEVNLSEYAKSAEDKNSVGYKAEVSELRALRDGLYLEARSQEVAEDTRTVDEAEQSESSEMANDARAEIDSVKVEFVADEDAVKRFGTALASATRGAQSATINSYFKGVEGLSTYELDQLTEAIRSITKELMNSKKSAIISGRTEDWSRSYEDSMNILGQSARDGSLFGKKN